MPLPNFLIIGAAKCGTTSLASYLAQHPDVFVSPWKEPNYFALTGRRLPDNGPATEAVRQAMLYVHTATDLPTYRRLFDGVNGESAIGEASVRYLYYPETAERIHAMIPEVKMVAVLREPVSRLYSHYCMMRQFQLEPLELPAALDAEETRIADDWGYDWHYRALGRYAEQLERYYRLFDREQLKVVLYDDFVERPNEVFREVCRHIGIDESFAPDMSSRGKRAYRPKNLALDRWLHWPNPVRHSLRGILPKPLYRRGISALRKLNGGPVPKIEPALRSQLQEGFARDNAKLEDLLGRKIPWSSKETCRAIH